jgi:hypothetical protein
MGYVMSVYLQKDLWADSKASKREKLLAMKQRQIAFVDIAKAQLSSLGFEFGQTLKLPGAYAYSAKKNGQNIRVGIKTAADRWVGVPRQPNGEWGLLSSVDLVFVVTVDVFQAPSEVEIYEFDPAAIIEKAKKVYATAAANGQTGLQWIPLDHHDGRSSTSMSAGPLGQVGKKIVVQKIEWIGDAVSASEEVANADEVFSSVGGLTITEAKRRLALTFGVTPDAIDITIRG